MEAQSPSISQLVTQYNDVATSLGRKVVKNFRDRATAVARVEKILVDAATKLSADPSEKKDRKKRGVNFLGMRQDRTAVATVAPLTRPNSIMARLLPLFLRGATLQELTAELAAFDKARERVSTVAPRARVYKAVRRLCRHGYGSTSEENKIKLFDLS